MESILNKAIQSAQRAEISYCKFLAANDTKATDGHQSGYLIGKSSWPMFLNNQPKKGENIKVDLTIKWQDDFETKSVFTYYGAQKDEFRLTRFGRNFPYRDEGNVGDLFVLNKIENDYFEAYILSSDDEIEEFFAAFNISSNDTNAIIPQQFELKADQKLIQCFSFFLQSLKVDFPTTVELATTARECYKKSFDKTAKSVTSDPDREILNWIDMEYQLFKIIESDRYGTRIKEPFKTVEELIEIANTILNRRKSRAGKSLEHHLSEVFSSFNLSFSAQAVTEDRQKPDFIFPGVAEYSDPKFNVEDLVVLAAKTTCKDRWRQVINEAKKVKTIYLFTLQQGISKNQLDEMYSSNVCLVVPQSYLNNFPEEYRSKIFTLQSFVQFVSGKQEKLH